MGLLNTDGMWFSVKFVNKSTLTIFHLKVELLVYLIIRYLTQIIWYLNHTQERIRRRLQASQFMLWVWTDEEISKLGEEMRLILRYKIFLYLDCMQWSKLKRTTVWFWRTTQVNLELLYFAKHLHWFPNQTNNKFAFKLAKLV